MGYKIVYDGGIPTMKMEQETTIATDMVLSVSVRKGSWFLNPGFGLGPLPKKMTDRTPDQVKQRFAEAWKWLLDTGKATNIDITAERAGSNRVNLQAIAVQPNGVKVPYQTFVEVI